MKGYSSVVRHLTVSILIVLASVLASPPIWACSVCFGNGESKQVQSAKMGVLVLMGFIGFVLTSIVGVALYWRSRARALVQEIEARRLETGGTR